MLACVPLRRALVTLLGGALALLGWLLLTPAAPVVAATQHVTNCTDTGVSGDGSLRGEIAAASPGDTIQFNLDCTGGTAITVGSTLTLTQNVTIDGTGHTIVVDGGCTFNGTVCTSGGVRVFLVSGAVTASLSNLTIQHGSNGGGGGGIYNNGGTLSVTNSTLAANSTSGGDGGGIYNNGGPLTVTNSTLAGNSAVTGNGAGIYNGGTLTLTNSTLAGNGAGLSGGGIYNASGRTLSATNSTITGNSAARGGGIYNNGGTANVTNTIVASNTATSSGPDLANTITSGGHNLFGTTSGATISGGSGDIVNPTPVLGTLGTYGGSTQTIPLLAGSPAVGAVPLANCTPTNDQRGLPRPSTGACAIGAFEPQTATYTVGTTTDTGTMDTFANCTTAGNMTCQLRDALAYASSGTDTVAFNTGGSGKITVGSTLTLAASVTVQGPTSGTGVIVDGGCTGCDPGQTPSGGVRVFLVNGVTASLSNLTIQHGNAGVGFGGGIENFGTLTVTNSTISGNVTRSNNTSDGGGGISNNGILFVTNSTITGNSASTYGGGILNDGTLTVTNSTFSNNNCDRLGGGILEEYMLTVTNSTFSHNSADAGGGIYVYDTGQLATVTNSTFSGNSATGEGGGIDNYARLIVTNSTLSGNSATGEGGGIHSDLTVIKLTNTIVAGNTATSGPDIFSQIESQGHNLIGNTNGGSGFAASDFLNFIPLLGTLGSNGGTTQTIPLLAGSVAIAHGDPAVCANTSGTAPVAGKDQRGVIRPSSLCAIGAYEPLLSAIAPNAGLTTGGTNIALTGAGFANGATVTVGGVACGNVQVTNSTTLQCTTGAHAGGAVDVVVTQNSQTGTLTGAYTYGTVTALPPNPPPSGSPGGLPSALPPTRPAGPPNGTTPNPLPVPRQ